MKKSMKNLEEQFSKLYDKFIPNLDFMGNLLFFIGLLLVFLYQNGNQFLSIYIFDNSFSNALMIINVIFITKIVITKESLRTYFIFIICMFISIICEVKTGNYLSISQVVLVVFASHKVELKKIIKFLFILNLIFVGSHILVYALNEIFGLEILELFVERIYYRDGFVRHSFYFAHPNVFSNYLFWTYMMYLYLNYEKKEKYGAIICLSIALALFTLVFPMSRNAFFFFMAAPFLMILYQNKKICQNGLFKFINKFSFVIIFGLSLFLMFTFYFDNIFGVVSNFVSKILNNRIEIGIRYFNEYGTSLFGNLITEARNFAVLGKTDFILDNWYYYLIIANGIVISLVYIFAFTKTAIINVKNENWKILYFILIFVLYNCIECMGRGDMICFAFPVLFLNQALGDNNDPNNFMKK